MLTTWLCCLLLAAEPIDTKFVQVAPQPKVAELVQRSPGQDRAVVLIHGLQVHPFNSRSVRKADFQLWQAPGSRLVAVLSAQADVYAVAYSQNADLEAIAAEPALVVHLGRLKELGYREIVLLGHSAGGLLARQLVEDQPQLGVTKVIQVCTPNAGSSWGNLSLGVRKVQEPFLESLTKDGRRQCLARRQEKSIPANVEFVCLMGQLIEDLQADVTVPVGDGRELRFACEGLNCGDGILSLQSQWPEDLQRQGIPVYPLRAAHFTAMFTSAAAMRIAELLTQSHPRWAPEEVDAVRQKLFLK